MCCCGSGSSSNNKSKCRCCCCGKRGMVDILFIFSLILFYFTSPPKKMPKSHPIIEHILIFLQVF